MYAVDYFRYVLLLVQINQLKTKEFGKLHLCQKSKEESDIVGMTKL